MVLTLQRGGTKLFLSVGVLLSSSLLRHQRQQMDQGNRWYTVVAASLQTLLHLL